VFFFQERLIVPSSMESIRAVLNYQSPEVPRSLYTTGKVYVTITPQFTPYGTKNAPTEVTIRNGRNENKTIHQNGFQFIKHTWEHCDYYDEEKVVKLYYPVCEQLLKEKTGAKKVVAFDHNVRHSSRKDLNINGNTIQQPANIVHNDFTFVSAPKRIKQMGEPLVDGEVLKKYLGEKTSH